MADIFHFDRGCLEQVTTNLLVSVERVHHGDHVLHDHEFHELVLVEAGRGTHLLDSGEWPIQSGTVFLIPAGVRHGYRIKDEIVLRNILFVDDVLQIAGQALINIPAVRALLRMEPDLRSMGRGDLQLNLSADQLQKAILLIDSMQEELGGKESGYEAVVMSLLIQLVIFLSRSLEDPDKTKGQTLIEYASLLSQIENHISEPFSLESMASANGISVRTYLRKIHEATGSTPLQYHNRYRISRARELLESSGASITEVGYACGFYDSSHFSRSFKKSLGVSPRKYRADHRQSVQIGREVSGKEGFL